MQKSFYYYEDPSHGWLKVPITLLKKLKIEEKITSCSYVRGNFAFLEEDVDASLFIEKMKALGHELKVHFLGTDRSSKIRKYDRYQGQPPKAKALGFTA